MTKWQIFALSAPAIIVAVMWLQGRAESYFDNRNADGHHRDRRSAWPAE